jgi:hypothetical protein
LPFWQTVASPPPRGALRAFGGHFILIGLRLNDLVDLIL